MNIEFLRGTMGAIALAVGGAMALAATGTAQVGQEGRMPQEAYALAGRDVVGPLVPLALSGNPGLKAAAKRYEAARASIGAAGALPNSMAQITHFVESIQTRTGPQRQTIMVQQPVPWLGRLEGRRAVARSQAEMLWYAYAQAQFELIDRVTEEALELALAERSSDIVESNLQLLVRLEAVVEERLRAGGAMNDLLRVQVEIERFQDELARLVAKANAARESLEARVGGQSIAAVEFDAWEAPASVSLDAAGLLERIAQRNPRLAMTKSLVESQEARERLARLANRPDFTVGVNYIRTGEAINPSMEGSGDDPWAFMVGVSLPIWGKANNAVTLQAALESEAVVAQLEEARLQVKAQATAWLIQWQDAQLRLRRYEERLLPLARQSVEITEAAYRSGKASVLDVIDSDRSLLEIEQGYWEAAANAWKARWRLATLGGGLWVDEGVAEGERE